MCTPFFSTNKADRNDITEILLKVALNTINIIDLNLNRQMCLSRWSDMSNSGLILTCKEGGFSIHETLICDSS